MDFNEFQKITDSEKIILVDISPALDLSIATLSTGSNSYYLDVERVGDMKSGFYYLPPIDNIKQNGVDLTEATGAASVDSSAGSWHFDTTNSRIYFRPSSDATPADVSLMASFNLHLSNREKSASGKFYNPRISDVPIVINSSTEDVYFSVASIGGGNITFENTDGFFDKLSSRYIWKNRPISVSLGEADMTVASYATIFSGRMRDMRINENSFSFGIQDYREYLHKNLPINLFNFDNYPDMDESLEGKRIPVGYGFIEQAPAYLVDSTAQNGTYKFADHPVYHLYDVYNNGSRVAASNYTIDLNNGEFTFSSGWGGDPGEITVDFIGVPVTLAGGEHTFIDDFAENDIDSWTQTGDGGIYSWSVANEKVTGTADNSVYAYLLREDKEMFAGEIEVDITLNSSTSDNYGSGLVFGWTNITNNYHVILFPNKDKVKVMKYASGTLNDVAEVSMIINPDIKYNLKVTVSNAGVLDVYIDDTWKMQYDTGETWTPKPVGLFTRWAGTTYFEDFKVKVPYAVTGSQIIKDLIVRYLGVASADVDTTSFSNAHLKAAQYLRAYIDTDGITSKDLIGRIAISNLCRFLIGSDGKVYYSFWEDSDAESASLIYIDDELMLDHFETFDRTDEIFSTIKIDYDYSTGGSNGGTESYSNEWVEHTYQRPYTKSFKSCLIYPRDVEHLAYTLFQLVREPVQRVEIDTKTTGINLKVGDVVSLERRRGSSKTGKLAGKYRIIGLKKEIDIMKTTLTLISHNASLGKSICEEICQSTCQNNCQESCQLSCESTCELTCQSYCQTNCTAACLSGCQENCELNCTVGCTSSCTDSCESTCTETCQISCEDSCTANCTDGCEISCTLTCQSDCQTFTEVRCGYICEMFCQENAQDY